MRLQERIGVLVSLGKYLKEEKESLATVKRQAYADNNWFTEAFVDLAIRNITGSFLKEHQLNELASRYRLADQPEHKKKIGLVLAGNIPLVGFHDIMCVFLSGHIALIKPSSKDTALVKHIIEQMVKIDPAAADYLQLQPMLKNCDAYIATGSDNSSRYFEYYFSKYPNIIRRNRTSIALLEGNETQEELEQLADDICQYFGLGCRNVTKIFVPAGYDFRPLLQALNKYLYFIDHHKYKNNYDYHLAMHILNNRYYMTNGSVLLIEGESPFAPISELHYEFYTDRDEVIRKLDDKKDNVQCIVGHGEVPFGQAQCPAADNFADGVDTLEFLKNLDKTEVRRP